MKVDANLKQLWLAALQTLAAASAADAVAWHKKYECVNGISQHVPPLCDGITKAPTRGLGAEAAIGERDEPSRGMR